ncbi:MAG: MFS transporter [Promethearchaeota archaeon]|nr:MAG: MFS transporter [Candidatus Lokiarchaeota archaeon]
MKSIIDPFKERKIHSTGGHLLYSLGAIPSALPYNMIQSFLILFYTVYTGLPLGLAGLLLVFYGIWNAVNDPLLGYYMDKIKFEKWGRRFPYIIVGMIPFTIGFIFLWWVPWEEEMLIFLHAFIMLFLFDLGFTLTMTAWSALYTEMYEDQKERASVVALKDLIAFISSMVGILLPPLFADALGWPFVGLIFGLSIPITLYLSLLGSRERKEYQIDEPLPIIPAFKESLTNKPFLNITLTYTLIDFFTGLTLTVLPLYAKFILQMDDSSVGFAALGIAVGILISVPFWRFIYAKKGPKFGLLLAIGFFTATIWPLFLVNDFMILVVVTILPGFGAGGMLMTEPAMSAAIDSDELITGKRREATFNGILAFVARLSMVFSGITLILVQVFTGFDSEASVQSETALIGLKLLVSLVPIIGGGLAFLVFSFFPLNNPKFLDQQQKLAELHRERKAKIN